MRVFSHSAKGFHPRLIYISEPYENNLCFNVTEKDESNLTIIGKLYRSFTPSPDKTDFAKLSTSEETFKSIKSLIAERLRRSDSLWAKKTRVNDSLANLKELATEYLWKKHDIKGNKEPIISDSAVSSWWNDMLVAADEATIPQNMNKQDLKVHRKPGALEVNAEGKLHVQHIILASRSIGEMRRGWAFEIICIKRDGLWLVADAYPDPELNDKQVNDIVNQNFYKRNEKR